ncbi:MAG: ABC transporter ATP-binding protein [Melioribacteraceae bacterium]|nr:ABC transporter ATP-binding protein [Melioribacteraceae bacterium]
MEKILIAENISKSFDTEKKDKLEILKNISFDIEKNKITVIIGASGSGKSTLLHILSGLDKPDNGVVHINNIDLFSLKDEAISAFRNNNMGFIFQFHHLLPEFSALENISIPQMIKKTHLKKAEIRSKELLDIVGLSERYDHKPAALSGGEQQRVAVARALANNPDIIFADEPTGNLDSNNSEDIHNLFLRLRNDFNMTLLIVTHNPELVKLADRVLEMKDGKLFEK